jgi:glycosyltransferase involved in cell wall biosynthesis
MKKIVFDCERMKYANTGLYHYSLNLANHLQKNIDAEKEQLLFYTPAEVRHLFCKGSQCLLQNFLHKFYMPVLKSCDIWHTTYQNSQYVPVRNKKIKVVLTIHDLNFLYEKKQGWKKKKYLRHLQLNINRADAIICVSDFCKKDVLQFCDIKNKPLKVIYNGTNSLNEPLLNHKSYKPLKPFLFSIGTVNRKKNFHSLLPLLRQNNNMELLIAGRLDDSEYLRFIHQSAMEMNVADSVRVLGQISESEKSWYFQNCYAFTFPSLAEGFGLPVAEAMSVGKPLFLSDKTALPEIGRNVAFYFKSFNPGHIQQVFTDGMAAYNSNGLREKIKKRGHDFCWEKAAKQYLEVYRSLY